MQIYKVLVTKTKYGYLAEQPEYGLAIDADTIENVISAMKNQVEQEGVIRLRSGEPLPESKLDNNRQTAQEEFIFFIEVDIEKKFRDSASESVRKNISMPAWMDIQLRYHGVDASKLFQDAATAYLEKKTKQNEMQYKKITSVEELIENVDKDVLNEYIMKKLL